MNLSKKMLFGAVLCALILGLSNSGLHPVTSSSGYTGAPGDSNCAQCHTGNNSSLDGSVFIDGLPSTVETGLTYTITVTINNPNGNATRAGFQLVALTGTNTNAGDMASSTPNTQIRTVSGNKKYFGHAPASDFPASNSLSFDVDWTAPSTTGSNPVIKFYASAVIANGANGNQNDRVVLTNMIVPITSGTAPISLTLNNVSNTSCSNSSDGTATVIATGGTGIYNYLWNNGITTAVNNSLPSGLASVTVSDSGSSNSSISTVIGSPSQILISASGSIVCQGASNGAASALSNGGNGGFTYVWSTGQTGNTIGGLSPGNYLVTVTDINNCTASSAASVIESSPIIIVGTINNPSCNNSNNGSIILNINGGTPNYSYQWSNGSNISNPTGLAPGNYSVTVTDAISCTAIESFQITAPTPLNVQISNIQNASCYGLSNGSATINVSGGSPGYNISWSNGATNSGNTSSQNNLIAGNYNVTVTDLFDCQKVVLVEITQPPQLLINTILQNNISCNGANDGAISVLASQNLGTVSYLWSNNATTSSIINLAAGNYTVTVQDLSNGCTQTKSHIITNPSPIGISVINKMNVTCFGGNDGSITLNSTGGNGGYSYSWSNGSNGSSLSNITAGSYQVTVTDINNCSASQTIQISQPEKITIDLISSNNVSCLGANNGSLHIQAANGVMPYSYSWLNGFNGNQISNLPFGVYIVTATDSKNCNAIDTFEVLADTAFNLTVLSKTDINCFGDSTGNIKVLKDSTYMYQWSNNMIGDSIFGLPAGIYTVIATDTFSCQSVPLQISLNQPSLIKANLIQSDTIVCLADTTGYLNVQLTGGVGNLTYQWSIVDSSLLIDSLLAGIYTISITDENNCKIQNSFKIYKSDTLKVDSFLITLPKCAGQSNGSIFLYPKGGFGDLKYKWSNAAITGDSIYNLKKGSYVVTITDFGNCKLIDTFAVSQPDTLNAIADVINESVLGANDGRITLNGIGGTSPYTVKWNTGDTTLVIENLSPGLYTYNLTDHNGCTASGWSVVGGGNCVLSATYNTKPSTCFNSFDGSIKLDIFGNFTEYQIQLFKNNKEISNKLDSVSSGKYTIIISDSMQCQSILSGIIVNSLAPQIIIETIATVKPSSIFSNDGSISITSTGGAGNLNYKWISNGIEIGMGHIIENLTIGKYNVVITDTTGCNITSDTIELNAISKTNQEISNSIKVAPNPINNQMTILNASGYTIDRLTITDLRGRNIYNVNSKLNQNLSNIPIDESFLSGIYILTVWINNEPVNKKIMILK